MRKVLAMTLFAFLTLAGCGGKNVQEATIPQDKIYSVIFEGDPDLTDKRVVSSVGTIGDILVETPSGSDLTVVKISIKEQYTDSINSNTVFVATKGYLKTDSIGQAGEPVAEGGRLLGFTGKTKLLWFKTKAKVSGLSTAAKNKAAELYGRVR
jgi:hypothetical protein